jgi:S1-C subfamily serine protease
MILIGIYQSFLRRNDMLEICIQCGGDIREDGNGYKCTCCGMKYASLDELRPQKTSYEKAPKMGNPGASYGAAYEVEQYDHGVDVFDMNVQAVLEITWTDERYVHSGSGFLVSRDGYAITNTHVVTYEDGRSCGRVNVKICGQNVKADVIKLGDNLHGSGNGVDLALIKLSQIPQGAVTVTFDNFERVRNGERVFVIGNSLGYGTCITSGIVSDRSRIVDGERLLMTDCAVNSGNSGGPIFNEMGRVIGAIVSGISGAEGMNFAIPADTVIKFMKDNYMSPNQYNVMM